MCGVRVHVYVRVCGDYVRVCGDRACAVCASQRERERVRVFMCAPARACVWSYHREAGAGHQIKLQRARPPGLQHPEQRAQRREQPKIEVRHAEAEGHRIRQRE